MAGVRRPEDLFAWQLGMRLAERIDELLRRMPLGGDFKFCSQLREASEAISANIAEGFDRYTPKQFHYFLQIAKGSVGETASRIRHGYTRGYWTVDEFNELLLLAKRTRGAVVGLIAATERRIAESEQQKHPQRQFRQHQPRKRR